MVRKKICIITGSRAEWGLFYPLADEIRRHRNEFLLRIIATGAHLSSDFGFTYKEIERDGFKINRKVKMLLSGDTEEVIAESVSLGIKTLSGALRALKPDLAVLLGDRFEIFAAAASCFFLKIPIAHIHGGELTAGSLDDSMRHAITKIASMHFVSTDTYRKRVIQMGENPGTVFNVGALGLDNIRNLELLKRKEFEEKTSFKLGGKNIMVTFNPLTSEEKEVTREQFKNLLETVDELPDTKIIFTKPNPDMYSSVITGLIDGYVSKNKERAVSFASMGRLLYLSALQFMDAVIGNSSSGIIEVPSFSIPTVNIGDRQEGRVKPGSVIDAEGTVESIGVALRKAFSWRFRKACEDVENPYGNGNAARRIVMTIRKTDFSMPRKRFFDIKFNEKMMRQA